MRVPFPPSGVVFPHRSLRCFLLTRQHPSVVSTWQAYIDFEISECENERTRQLYERLLERTKHVKVWMSFAHFEASAPLEEERAAEEEARLADPDAVLEEQQDRWPKARGDGGQEGRHRRERAREGDDWFGSPFWTYIIPSCHTV